MKHVLGVARLNFLTLTIVCVLLALAYSLAGGTYPSLTTVLLVTLVALTAHISVNAFNEYFDFRSGLDFRTRRTAFSGGSGTLVAAPHLAPSALLLAIASLLLTVMGGLWLVVQHGVMLLWIGIPGVLIIYTYTQYLNRSPILCLLAPGAGFGLLMTLGAIWIFSASLNGGAWWLAVIMTLLVSNLLLLNQFPDVEADKTVGRRHVPIVLGYRKSSQIFAAIHIIAWLALPVGVLSGVLPWWSLLGLFSMLLLWPLLRGVLRHAHNMPAHSQLLGLNVAFIHVYPLLIAIGLLLAWWLN